MEDKPILFDTSDLNQSVLNKISADKFRLILSVPKVLQNVNTSNIRENGFVSLDSLQFSCINISIPSQSIAKIDLRFAGQGMPVSSFSRPSQQEVTIRFAVDNNFNNYNFLWRWLDELNHCKESIPTKGHYDPISEINELHNIGVRIDSSEDEVTEFESPRTRYKNSFFDYQTRITVEPLREYNEPIAKFTYTNAFITELGQLEFDYTKSDQLECSFKFAFGQQYFELLKYNPSTPKER